MVYLHPVPLVNHPFFTKEPSRCPALSFGLLLHIESPSDIEREVTTSQGAAWDVWPCQVPSFLKDSWKVSIFVKVSLNGRMSWIS